ncbi:MAG: thioesterase family protein [Sphingomonadaceae bacterium]|nr:thioesterase family protein [Sphingomonadaceae bacterium]
MAAGAPGIAEDDPFALEETGGGTFVATIAPRLATGRPGNFFMFGGSGMALAARAIQRHSGEPPRWLTVQFVAATPRGERLALSVERIAGGRVGSSC